ncbi:MAG: 1-acyl-sn-glycerol-3-phosphate acyltransferase [Flavobacteriaceae bacterium]|nr:1-acyl-sn-glycerol-3-phosphate acyltransferase [Flavobacteriaceae bacterium]
MRSIKIFLGFLWHIWFYLLIIVPIIVFLPILFILTLKESWYPQFYWFARHFWATPILYGMGCLPVVKNKQKLEKNQSYVLVANHGSMLDIMLMMYVSKRPFVFVGKKELVKTPIFGFFYKRVCILVDRSSATSRTGVYKKAFKRLQNGLSICIFPEGGVPDDESIILDSFKDGAFNIAISQQIPIVPYTFLDCKRRFPFSWYRGKPGLLRVLSHPIVPTQGLTNEDKEGLKTQVRRLILGGL